MAITELKWTEPIGGVFGDSKHESDSSVKSRFHKQVVAFIRQVAKQLPEYPLLDIHSNKGGIAVSGEIYFKFKINDTRCIEAWIEEDIFKAGHIIMIARISEYKIGGKYVRIGHMGTNIHMDPCVTVERMAAKLRGLVEGKGFDLHTNVVTEGDEQPIWDMRYGVDHDLEPDPVVVLGPAFTLEGEPIEVEEPAQLSLFEEK